MKVIFSGAPAHLSGVAGRVITALPPFCRKRPWPARWPAPPAGWGTRWPGRCADGGDVHALDLREVQVQAGGDDQVVVADALAAVGDHGVGGRVELGHHLAHPLHARRDQVGVAVADLVHRPHAGGHQGVAGLVVVLFLAVDDGDLGAVEQARRRLATAMPPRPLPAMTAAGTLRVGRALLWFV
jgi:hypothetical protein